jgi:hypothetical protein
MHEICFGNLLDESKMLKIKLGSKAENEILTFREGIDYN